MVKKRTGRIFALKQKSGWWRRLLGLPATSHSLQCAMPSGEPMTAYVPLTRSGHNLLLGPGRVARPPGNGIPLPSVVPCQTGLYPVLKRGFDFVLAGVLLVLTAPLVLLAMALVKLTSRGPALYTQTRVGLDGVPFTIFKLRTMVHECESLTGARWSVPGDSRVTPLGRFLRKTHFDELPQLWNVLRGDMGLVGPRPERPEFVPRLEQAIPHYRARLLVRPGVTGLAQLQLPPDTDLDSVRRKLAYDLYYVQRLSLLLDLRLMAGTGLKIVGASFGVLRRLLWLPRPETIEQAYASLPVESRPAAVRVHAT